MVYTPLLNYAAKSGEAGTVLHPALVEALPTISADGLTYTMKLRSGLTYSDGTPVKASDFTLRDRALDQDPAGAARPSSPTTSSGADDYGKGKATPSAASSPTTRPARSSSR